MANERDDTKPLKQLEFHFIKSNYHRVVMADGAFGGITPTLHLNISFYNERSPLPQITARSLEGNGITYTEEIVKEIRGGIVREVETTVVMNESAARELRNWLNRKLDDFESVRKQIEDAGTKT